MKDKTSRLLWIGFILVAIVFLTLRLYNLSQRIIFDWDQEQFSTQIKQIVINHKLTLLGPRATNDSGFFLGPYFTYLLIPFYLLTNLHPSALIYFIVIYNLLFFGSAFLIIGKLFGKLQALTFLILWSIISILVAYDTIPWWPILIPLGVVLIWLALYKIFIQKNKLANYILLGLLLGLFSNIHSQFAFLILFSVFFFISNRRTIKLTLAKIASLLGAFIITFLPLALFDLRHNWLNSKLFIAFFTTSSDNRPYDPNVWREVFTNFLLPLINQRSQTLMFIFYLIIFFLAIYLYKHKQKFSKSFYWSFIGLWLFVPLLFSLYAKRPSEYYFVFLYPFICIVLVDFFLSLRQKWLLLPFLLLILAFNWQRLALEMKTNPLRLYYKDKTIKELKTLLKSDREVKITFDTPLGLNSGFVYLIDYYQINKGDDNKLPLVEIRNPRHPGDIKINDAIGLKIPAEVRRK